MVASQHTPDVTVVIVSWNTRDLLERCLRSIGPHGSAEVVVVDNASADGSAEMVHERFTWVRLIQNDQNLGFAKANNQAIRVSAERPGGVSQYVVLLNSDTEVHPGALDALVAFAQAHPRAGAAGARLLNGDGSLQPSCHPMLTPGRELWRLLFLERVWPRATYPMHRWDPQTPRQVEAIKGACLLLRREALDEAGLLDEGYFMYTEEVDLCYRLARAGWELWWVPQAEVVHLEAQSTRQDAEPMFAQLYRSKVQFYRKFGGPRLAERFKWLLRLVYWPRLAAAGLGAVLSPTLAARARIYRRLLTELPGM